MSDIKINHSAIPLTNVTVQMPDGTPPEVAQRFIQSIREQNEKEVRERKIFEQGQRSGSRGLLGIFGL
jgi:hypothetical protein